MLKLLKSYPVVMIGAREFQSVQLGKWLDEKGIAFILRQKKGTSLLLSGEDKYQPLKALDIQPGTEQFFSGIYYTDSHKLGLFNLATRWTCWLLSFCSSSEMVSCGSCSCCC